jgi:hypothetical protein
MPPSANPMMKERIFKNFLEPPLFLFVNKMGTGSRGRKLSPKLTPIREPDPILLTAHDKLPHIRGKAKSFLLKGEC